MQYGKTFHDHIRRHLELLYDLASERSNVSKEKALSVAARFDPFIHKFAPGFCDELEGMSVGADISYMEAVLLQVRQEVVNLHRHGLDNLECTSYAISSEYSVDGKTYSGQNADLTGDFEDFTSVVTFKVEGKPSIMMVIPAGQLSYLGMNDLGMSVNCNFLVCDGWKEGFPRYLISRLLLEQRTVEEACSIMAKLERASSRNILICDRDDRMIDFETTATKLARIDATGFFVHSNHFIDPAMRQYETSTEYELRDSESRYNRMREMISGNKGKINNNTIKRFLRNHLGEPHTVCMHINENNSAHTFASIINDLTDGVMEVAMGNPCCSEYAAYEIGYGGVKSKTV